jgi:Zn-dependent protease
MFHNFPLNQLVVMLVPLLFAVTVHEVAHGYTAYRLGDPTARLAGRLTLNPLKHLDIFGSLLLPALLKLTGSPVVFGYARPVPVNFSKLRDFRQGVLFVSAAGCAANLVLVVLSGLLFRLLLKFSALWFNSLFRPVILDLFMMLGYSVLINAVLAIFNLIPIPPLDGSRILAMFLPEPYRQKYLSIGRLGMILIIFLLISNSLNRLIKFFLDPMLLLALGRDGIRFISGG